MVFFVSEIEIEEEFKYIPPEALQSYVSISPLSSPLKRASGHKCTRCRQTFKWKDNLYRHLQEECSGRPKLSGYTNETKSSLSQQKSDSSCKEYKCETCCKTYKSEDALVRHRKYVCVEKSKFFCDQCSYSSHRKNNVDRHTRYKHALSNDAPLEKPYVCVTCGKRYKWKGNLTQHLRLECGKKPGFFCAFCDFCCKQKGSLARHIGFKHGFVKSNNNKSNSSVSIGVTCEKCGKTYGYLRNLWYHQKYDCGKKASIFCTFCSYSCKHREILKKHIQNQHQRDDSVLRYSCIKYNRSYKYQSSLRSHVKYLCQK
ncbi:zinc finger protein 85-like [Phymastichus coffea]|uniref:zinc finger protein 85-like n=1 Tax=Phymastichus coffea TaxID=108790 RepID=UPI00273CE26E|nr:zinc finger protein 85-like [Phymastichus coffea]